MPPSRASTRSRRCGRFASSRSSRRSSARSTASPTCRISTRSTDGLKTLDTLPTFGAAAASLRWLKLAMEPGAKPLASLAPLAALTHLRHLTLWVSVGDRSLQPLHGLKHLEHVDISPSKHPKTEITALRALLPGVAGNLHVDRGV